MNPIISSICIVFTMATLLVSAQDPAVLKRLDEIKQAFDELPNDEKTKFLDLKNKAYQDFKLKKYFTCMVAVSDARLIFPDDFDLIFFTATCRAQLRNFDEAIESYNQVLEINPQHIPSLISLIDINLYDGKYEEAIKQIKSLNKLIDSRGASSSSLLDFKYLICLVKLSAENPGKYDEELKKMYALYTYMDDELYYYYARALNEFVLGNREEGLSWVIKAYLIFRDASFMEGWSAVLIDTGYVYANEIMANKNGDKN